MHPLKQQAMQNKRKSTKHENTFKKMLILGSLEALQPIQTWSHANAGSSIQELRSCTCTSPSPQCVCVRLCCCVYLCVPVLLYNCVRCICKLLLAHIAASIQFRNGCREKKTLPLSKHQCSSWKVNVPCKEAIILPLKLFFNL